MSAFFISTSVVSPSLRREAMPTLAPMTIWWPSMMNGARHRLDDALGDRGGVARLVDRPQQQREFVAAEPRQHVGLARRAPQPRRGLLQHLVADGVAERVVDRFEVVEVDAQHRDLFAALDARPRQSAISSRNCVRLGSSVSASCRARCWMRASCWRCSVMSSWVDTNPPSFIGWCCIMMVRLLELEQRSCRTRRGRSPRAASGCIPRAARAARMHAAARTGAPRMSSSARAGPHQLLGQIVDARIGGVADHEPPARVEHAQALADIVDRRVEPDVLPLEFALALLDDLAARRSPRSRPHASPPSRGRANRHARSRWCARRPAVRATWRAGRRDCCAAPSCRRRGIAAASGPGWLPISAESRTTSSRLMPSLMLLGGKSHRCRDSAGSTSPGGIRSTIRRTRRECFRAPHRAAKRYQNGVVPSSKSPRLPPLRRSGESYRRRLKNDLRSLQSITSRPPLLQPDLEQLDFGLEPLRSRDRRAARNRAGSARRPSGMMTRA